MGKGKHRTHAGSGVIPGTRKDRRQFRRRNRALIAQLEQVYIDQAKEEKRSELEERRASNVSPAAGAPGPHRLRNHHRLRVPGTRVTSDIACHAYPFLAEGGLGAGMFVGQDSWSGAGFCWDPWYGYAMKFLTNPNVFVAGSQGNGKSSLMKTLATRGLRFGHKVYVAGDPKGEWTVVCEAVGGKTIHLGYGSGERLNPLDEGPRPGNLSEGEWGKLVAQRRRILVGSLGESTLGRKLTPHEHTCLTAAVTSVVDDCSTVPTLPMVVDAIFTPHKPVRGATVEQLTGWGSDLGHSLQRLVDGDLAGMFDGESTVDFDPDAPMVTVDLSSLLGSPPELMAMIMACCSSWMEAAITGTGGGNRWMIYDEAWMVMKHRPLLDRMQAWWKLSRNYGIANVLIIHRLSDLNTIGGENSDTRNLALGLMADCATKVIYQQGTESLGDITATLGLSRTEREQLPDLEPGEALWRTGKRSFVVRHLVTEGEWDIIQTDSKMQEGAA